MTKFLPFVLDFDDKYYHNDKSFHLVAERIYWLGAFLNSKLFRYCFQGNFPELLGGTRELRKVFFEKIPWGMPLVYCLKILNADIFCKPNIPRY